MKTLIKLKYNKNYHDNTSIVSFAWKVTRIEIEHSRTKTLMMDLFGMKRNHAYKVTPPYRPRHSLLSSTPMKFGMDGEIKGIKPAAKRLKIQFEKSDFATTPIKINSDDLHCGAGIEVEIVSEYSYHQQNETTNDDKKIMECKNTHCVDENGYLNRTFEACECGNCPKIEWFQKTPEKSGISSAAKHRLYGQVPNESLDLYFEKTPEKCKCIPQKAKYRLDCQVCIDPSDSLDPDFEKTPEKSGTSLAAEYRLDGQVYINPNESLDPDFEKTSEKSGTSPVTGYRLDGQVCIDPNESLDQDAFEEEEPLVRINVKEDILNDLNRG